jgi:hypothetical protein
MKRLTLEAISTNGVAALPATTPPYLPCIPQRRLSNSRLLMPAAPRRLVCYPPRVLLAAARKAELAAWMNSGGDFLNSIQQSVA